MNTIDLIFVTFLIFAQGIVVFHLIKDGLQLVGILKNNDALEETEE
jgi:hypothetical protein